jgi:ElaB/YqjD/DUF883 family membrane-anchored ribosome-binding protein
MPDNGPTQNLEQELGNSVAAVRDTVRTLLDRGSERAGHIKDTVMERGKSAIGTVQHTVEERPLVAIGGAFAVGLLLGLWLRRH